jgi:hypothetical protein
VPYTPRARRDETLCLTSIGDRLCVAAKDHTGVHHFIPRPRPGRLTSNDLYLDRVRVGESVQRLFRSPTGSKQGTPMKIVHITTDGIVVMRSLTVGNVFLVTGETFLKSYVIMRHG